MICNLCASDNPAGTVTCKRCGKKLGKPCKRNNSPATVLLVEDNSYIRLMMQALLNLEGYTVIEAEDGVSGVDKAIEHNPDLILMDILLPLMNGVDAIAKLKQDPRTGHIPIIAVTCLDTKKDVIKAVQAGCDDYLKKPIIPQALMEKIKKLLKSSR